MPTRKSETDAGEPEAAEQEIGADDYYDPETGELVSGWVDVEPLPYRFKNPGDAVEGVYRGISTQVIDGDETTRHDLDSVDGPRFFWGGTVIDGRLQHVDVGDYIRVTFTGLSDKTYRGGNPAKLFRVQRRT